jgi:hypothetical protein
MRDIRSYRRLDMRPAKKLRNPGRHMRAFARWPDWVEHQLPEPWQVEGDRFWNFKVPVWEKAVDPPHATVETQRACLATILATMARLEASPLTPRPCRVACLVETPGMFGSEVTLFYDDDYFRTFLPPAGASRHEHERGWVAAEPADPGVIAAIRSAEPEGITFHGGTRMEGFDVDAYEPGGGWAWMRYTWVWSFEWR